jgi:hypothetical protein
MNPMRAKSRITKSELAANKRSYWSLAIGATLATVLIAMLVWLPPVFSARQMALAQAVPVGSSDASSSPPIHGDLISPPSAPPERRPAGGTAALPATSATTTNAVPVCDQPPAQSGAAVVASPAAPAMPSASQPPETTRDGYLDIGFDKLGAYKFEVTDAMVAGVADPAATAKKISDQIPTDIKALDRKRVAVKGFMLPLYVRHARVTQFLLLRNQMMCCYGITPRMNEWIVVNMPGGVHSVMDRTITVYGTLNVGESRENNALVGIYQMAGDKLDAPEIQ